MSDAYENVMGGKLKLKGGITKKKKKRSSEGESSNAVVETPAASDAASSSAQPMTTEAPTFGHTKSELRRLELQQQRKFDQIEKGKLPTHKEQ
eukprot:7328269-Prymnesium_polylepis.1